MLIEVKKNIQIPIFGGMISIVITNESNLYESAKRNFNIIDETLKTYDGLVLRRDKYLSARIYPVLLCKNITPGIIAHEALHIVNLLFEDVQIKKDINNDESEAYVLGWIVNRIWEVKTKFEKKIVENEKST